MNPLLISRKIWEIGISTLFLRWYAISRNNSRFANLRIFATSIFSPFQGSLLHSKMRIHNFLSWPSIWIFLEVTHCGNLNFILPQILREIINKLSKGVFTCSILTNRMYLTSTVGRGGIKYFTPREGTNFFPARRRRKGKKF